MVIKAIEKLIDELKLEESLEYLKRKNEYMNSKLLGESYRKSDRAGWVLNKLKDNLVEECKEYERKDDGSGDIRSKEEKQKHQECFGLIARIQLSKV